MRMDSDTTERMTTVPSISITEFQHHVRNTLAIVRSLVRRSAHASDSVDQLVGALDGRIGALGRAQSHLTYNPSNGADLEAIVCDELLAHQIHVRGAVSVDGPAVQLTWKSAVTLGLAFHELVTNAIRYGALADEGGRLGIGWTLTSGQGGLLRIRWQEDFAEPRADSPSHNGFGREFLEQTLAYELDAAVEFDLRPGGLDCVITLPEMPTVLGAA